ncbi:MAG: 7-cyano-7-deazaguanine synthase [Methanothrix sp.]|jgi:7-cyano-7-deazaguanine synthase|uniref:7-cyano-7-deazaguanine synthase n=1 Tax=Methanothrix sp. TaxID=90426 RepID=UPI003BB5C46E
MRDDKSNNYDVLVLLSGGLDSTACTYYYINMGLKVKALFIAYGQRANKIEYRCANNIAKYFGIPLDCFRFEGKAEFLQGEIKGRNAFLALSALLANPEFKGLISMGIHSGTPYYDCSVAFIQEMNRILEGYTDGRVILAAPFLKWDKRMIYNYFKDNGLPFHLTYSCEDGTDFPCGKCPSCQDRCALNAC